MAADTLAYDEIRKELRHMCEAFHELFKDELDEKVKAGEKKWDKSHFQSRKPLGHD
jgi:hypothetical protein